MEKRITLAANVCIIVLAIVTIFVLFGRTAKSNSQARLDPKSLIGHSLPLKADWRPNSKTVVLALQVGCHYCSNSAPFYRHIASLAPGKGIGMVAVLPQLVAVDRAYLKEDLRVDVANVYQSDLDRTDVDGTPTIFLVDAFGVVTSVWQGQLKQEDEAKFIASLD